MPKELSAKQKLFAQGVAKGLTQEKAWIKAGYSNTKAKQAASRAMATNVYLKEYIAELQKPAEDDIRLTAEKAHEELLSL